MNDLPINNDQQKLQAPGSQLRLAREAADRSVEYVAEQLKVPVRYILLIEADDFEPLPHPAFTKGYIRAYGRLFGMDTDALMERFNACVDCDSFQSGMKSRNSDVAHSDTKIRSRIIKLAIVVVSILAAAIYFRPTSEVIENTPVIEPAIEIEVEANAGVPDELLATAQSNDNETTLLTEQVMVLSAVAQCWIEVVGSDGEVLLSTLAQPGSSHEVLIDGYVELTLGDGSAVNVVLNDEPLVLEGAQAGVVYRSRVEAAQ